MFRDEATANIIRESQRRRYQDPATVDKVIEVDQQWRKLQFLSEATKKFVNDCSRAVGEKKKAREADGEDLPIPEDILAKATEGKLDTDSLKALNVTQLKSLSKWSATRVADLAKEALEAETLRDSLLNNIGNIVHESVPVEIDEEKGNTIASLFGDVTRRLKYNHVDIMEKLGMMDTSRTVTSMAGGRSYVLKGGLVQLQVALISYGISFLVSRGYTPFYPPFFMTKEAMGAVAQLSQFDEELYKVTGEGEDKYLIATSEMPIAAYHRNKTFASLPEPIKYAGMSACFRKEAGAHGRDTTGIFRVHQFDKIEQFVVCSPKDDESWKILDQMIGTSEEFCKSLGLPYRVVNICSGALNNAAAKKFDLEAWFPGSGAFRELVSCSNCTDYQARGVNCRHGSEGAVVKGAAREYCHMLNGTLCAVTRTMCCICENYQTDEGVIVPEVLRPFMLGRDFLKFEAEAPAAPAAAAPQ